VAEGIHDRSEDVGIIRFGFHGFVIGQLSNLFRRAWH
jgi:hypothetical protein